MKWGLAIVFIAVLTGPVFLLFGKSLFLLWTDRDFHPAVISSSLFFRSVLMNASAAFLCGILGVAASLCIWTYFGRRFKEAFFAVLLCALIPPFIHVHAWIKAMDALNALVMSVTGFSSNFTGVGAVIWTTAFSYLPFTMAFCLMGLVSIPQENLDMLKLEIRPYRLFRRCIVPSFLPYVLISGFFVFLLIMNDYSIPSVFGVNVYALELFSIFSANGNLYTVALSSVPLILLSALLLGIFVFAVKRFEMTNDPVWNENPFRQEPFMKFAAKSGMTVLVLFAGIPVGSMIIESFFTKDFFKILLESSGEILYSFAVSGGVAVLAVLPAALLSYLWIREKGKPGLFFLLALPFLIPSAILGLGLIAFWNQGGLDVVYQSPFMPVIGLAVRFGIFPILFLTFRMSRIEKDLLDAMHLSYPVMKGFFRILLPMIRKDLVACALLVFSLSMGEYGIVLLITPPGYQMLTIKIYNYLHYGASEVVFALNLVVFLLVALVWIAVFLLYRPKKSKGADSSGPAEASLDKRNPARSKN